MILRFSTMSVCGHRTVVQNCTPGVLRCTSNDDEEDVEQLADGRAGGGGVRSSPLLSLHPGANLNARNCNVSFLLLAFASSSGKIIALGERGFVDWYFCSNNQRPWQHHHQYPGLVSHTHITPSGLTQHAGSESLGGLLGTSKEVLHDGLLGTEGTQGKQTGKQTDRQAACPVLILARPPPSQC